MGLCRRLERRLRSHHGPASCVQLLKFAFFAWSLSTLVVGEQHNLLDSTKEQMLDWSKYPHGPKSPTPGWVEESFTNFDKGINWRSYVVCDVSYPDVNNWLWTPFIERGDANRIYIEIKFSIRSCDLFPGKARQCKETFSLLFYEFDAATREPPPWEPESYKLIDRIAADQGRFRDNDEVIINKEVRSVDVNKKGIYFAFMDEGACISLLAIKVYYITCPEVTHAFAKFPKTPTGKAADVIVKKEGVCVPNANYTSDPPLGYCTSEGVWLEKMGGCQCMAGYEPATHINTAITSSRSGQSGVADKISSEENMCRECGQGRYKPLPGSAPCEYCPDHSEARYSGSVVCRCMSGYYRAKSDNISSPCTKPPSAPRNLTITSMDSSTLTLAWEPPRHQGGRDDILYSVRCMSCPSGIRFSPNQDAFPGTYVTVTGLTPLSTYVFHVYSKNGVSEIAQEPASYANITVRASSGGVNAGDSSGLTSLKVKSYTHSSVLLTWSSISDPYSDIQMYEVRYFIRGAPQGSNDNNTVTTRKEELEIKGLAEKTEYGFQVRAKTSQKWGDFTRVVYQMTRSSSDPVYLGENGAGADGGVSMSGDGGVPAIVGAVVAGLVLLTLLSVLLALYMRRGSQQWAKKQIIDKSGDCDTLEYRGGGSNSPHYAADPQGIVHTHTTGTLPLFNTFATHKTYIDPHTYEDPHQAVKQFAKELDPRFITIEAIIGGGEFGDVCRGRLQQSDRQDMLVAIKTLKPGSSDKARADFLTEASIMGQFEHPNVIFLQGVVTKATPIMIITEYMENGSLDTFLRANDGKFQVMQLVGMMRGIAYGMQYLAEMNYVHRDLAARNVLVNSQLVCKIADFGLSREISESAVDGAYTTRGGKIPVRWTAPEAIAFRKFTSSSDAWSFGIVMWEVMSYGERPYWNWSNQDVIKAIEKGYRLPAPMDCPEALHQLMLDCWQKERAHRPTFANIVKTLDKLICCPETLRKIASSQACNPLAPDAPDLTQFNSVDEWLASIKMSRYSNNFAAVGVVSMEQVAGLGLTQLTDMGVTLVGHKKKIINSIQAIRTQLSVNVSEGFLV